MELTHEEVGAMVDRAVVELLETAKCDRPPVDALQIAREGLGMTICLDGRESRRGRAQRANGKPHIYLRPEPRLERRQWAVAHEIGEHVKLSLLERLRIGADELNGLGRMTGESLANLFARRLLVPQHWLAEDAPACDYELPLLKERFGTASHEVIAWRLLDLPAGCVITIVDNDRVTRRRSNAWPVTRKLTPAEQECRRYVSEHNRPRTVRRSSCTVRGWPVHEQGWKREILRTVFDTE